MNKQTAYELVRYVVVGILTTLVSWLAYALLKLVLTVEDPIQMQVAIVLRWLAGVLFAYGANKVYVFRNTNTKILGEFIAFVGSRVITLISDIVVMFIMVNLLGSNDWIATVVSTIIITILNYIFSKTIFAGKAPVSSSN